MTTWNPPTDPQLTAGKPITQSIMRALRDMVLAFAEQSPGAPLIPPGTITVDDPSTPYVWTNSTGSTVFVIVDAIGGGAGTDTSDTGYAGGPAAAAVLLIPVPDGSTLTVDVGAGSGASGTPVQGGSTVISVDGDSYSIRGGDQNHNPTRSLSWPSATMSIPGMVMLRQWPASNVPDTDGTGLYYPPIRDVGVGTTWVTGSSRRVPGQGGFASDSGGGQNGMNGLALVTFTKEP